MPFTCDNVTHPAAQDSDEDLEPPLVQQGLPLLGVEAEHPATPGTVGGILPVRSNASPEHGVGLAGLQQTAGLDQLEIILYRNKLEADIRQTWL